ncbi:hypothetical protein LINGRAHAP2_LOCUS25296 [Linum grandiflorum]
MAAGGTLKQNADQEFFQNEDVLMSVLMRLPIALYIARLRCVCRSWRNLLSNPNIIAKILFFQNLADQKNLQILITGMIEEPMTLWASTIPYCLHNYETLSPIAPPTAELTKLPNIESVGRYNFVGCCDGIFCIIAYPNFILWNPTTSETKFLPPCPDQARRKGYVQVNTNERFGGFGFDPVTNDYKVVWMLHYEQRSNDYLYRNDLDDGPLPLLHTQIPTSETPQLERDEKQLSDLVNLPSSAGRLATGLAVVDLINESARCDCCGLAEECTPEYIERIRERYSGKWVCGLCNEAVKDEIVRKTKEKRLISTDEALARHMSFCKQFSSPKMKSKISEVYSLKNDSWKRVDLNCEMSSGIRGYGMDLKYVHQGRHKSRNEKCYWYYDKVPQLCGILSFDMSTEVFENVNFPYPSGLGDHDDEGDGGIRHNYWSSVSCFMLKESFVVTFRPDYMNEEDPYQIWGLLKYGVDESWTKLFTFQPPGRIYFNHLDIWKDTTFLFSHGMYRLTTADPAAKQVDGVFCLDPSTGETVRHHLEIQGTVQPFLAHTFAPTRVCLSQITS